MNVFYSCVLNFLQAIYSFDFFHTSIPFFVGEK